MTKLILIASALALAAVPALAQRTHPVRGYVTRSGEVVKPHVQTNPDASTANNYSTVGNVNPYTGTAGTKPIKPNKPR